MIEWHIDGMIGERVWIDEFEMVGRRFTDSSDTSMTDQRVVCWFLANDFIRATTRWRVVLE
jgi:hypothetical protein